MKASELILKLEKLIDEYGDLPVEIPSYGDIDYDDAKSAFMHTYDLGGKHEYTAILITQ